MEIEFKQIGYNRKTRTSPIKYIVIHDTQNKSRGAGRYAHFNYFNGGERSSSADFFVDSGGILQVNDYEKYYTFHVGDGKGKYWITNSNSIGIEICVNEDSDYNVALVNAVELVKYLMRELNVPIENVVRHYDASRKNCPASMSDEEWALWKRFKERIVEEKSMAECKFTDINGHYAEKQIKELFEMGIINGVDEMHFNPNENIKRADVAIMVRNAIRYITGK